MLKFPGFGQRNNEGPPDLDEVFKDLNNKINQLFGGKGKSGGNSNGATPIKDAKLPVLPILGIIAALWLASGFYTIDQGSRGVVTRFGKHVETTEEGPHWHIPYPVENAQVVNMEQVRTVEIGYRSSGRSSTSKSDMPSESLMLTDDENIIDLQLAVQYNLKSVEDFLFKNRSTEDSVRAVAETAIREVVGKSKMDFALYEGREELAINTKDLMQSILDRYQSGINVVNVNMQNAQPPQQVQAAFDDAVKAKQDLERQKNEGQAYANDVIPKARGTAARLAEEAAGYKLRVENEATGDASRFEQVLTQYNRAPEVTRQRLYIDAQEQVMSNTNKVVVNQKSGNSMLYLPLDKMMQSSGSSAPVVRQQTKSSQSDNMNESNINRSRDAFRSRDRNAR